MLRPGLYRDKHGVIVQIIAADDDGVTLRYADGSVVTVTSFCGSVE